MKVFFFSPSSKIREGGKFGTGCPDNADALAVHSKLKSWLQARASPNGLMDIAVAEELKESSSSFALRVCHQVMGQLVSS